MKKVNKKDSKAQESSPVKTSVASSDKKTKYNLWFLLMLFGFILFGVLLFNAKIFLMGDDADYILDAYYFVHDGLYPLGRSSLYAMVLGIPVLLFGTNVILLKCFSFICAIIGFFVLYKTYFKRIPAWMLYVVLGFSLLNSSLQYYSSSNLSEAFFMMIQYGFIATVFLLIIKLEKKEEKIMKYWLLVGFMGLMISLSKNIAIVAPLSLVAYFLLRKGWKNAGFALGAFLVFKIPYEILIRVLFKGNTLVSQWDQVMAKDLYHHEKGRETFSGFIDRIIENTQIYFSRVTLSEFGITVGQDGLALAAIIFSALLVYGFVIAYKKNKFVFFTCTYVLMMCAGTFVALQPAVAQDRIIIILVPLLLLIILFSLDHIFTRLSKKTSVIHGIGIGVFLCILFFMNLKKTFAAISENSEVLSENLGGDPLYGYTPDWLNYLEAGAWVKKNIPDSVVVAARKPNSLSIYSNGRPYIGIYAFPTDLNADQLLEKLKEDNIEYLVVASLRVNPNYYIPNNYISTIRNYVARIEQSYPGIFQVVHQVGAQETCFVLKINYPEHIQKK